MYLVKLLQSEECYIVSNLHFCQAKDTFEQL